MEAPIDFSTFVLSLSHSTLMHLGEAPHPESEKIEVDLALAQETLGVLAMLEEKTRGNLTGEEERLMSHVLCDLRARVSEREHKAT